MKKIFAAYKVYLPPVLWAICIFGLCSMSRNSFPEIDELQKVIFDKIVHFILYMILCILLIVCFIKQNNSYSLKNNCILYAITISAIYGVLIEVYQAMLTANRTGDWQDIVANITGSIIGLIGFYLVYGKPTNYIQ